MHRRKKGAAMRMQAGQCGHWCTKIPAFTGREYTGLREPGLGHAGAPINPTTGSSPWQAAFTQKQTLPASSSRRPARGRRKGKDSEKFQVMDDYL
ncbi:MAG: hypothetical protein OXC07_00435, partial [Kistimonas sp.]|nr:hypothetical protein [Kistimonas sp.]